MAVAVVAEDMVDTEVVAVEVETVEVSAVVEVAIVEVVSVVDEEAAVADVEVETTTEGGFQLHMHLGILIFDNSSFRTHCHITLSTHCHILSHH